MEEKNSVFLNRFECNRELSGAVHGYTIYKYGRCFDEVCFAIYGKPDGKNILAFQECFKDVLTG